MRSGAAGSVDEQLAAVEPLVRQACRARVGPVDGDDAAQQTLLTIWRRLESGPPVDSLPAYAVACARYQALTEFEAARRRPVPSSDWASGEWSTRWVDPAAGPAEQVERAAEVTAATERVERLLASLTPRRAQVIRETVLAERGSVPAGARLGLRPVSVRTAQLRALADLRARCGVTAGPAAASDDAPVAGGAAAGRARLAAAVADERAEVQDERSAQLTRWHTDDTTNGPDDPHSWDAHEQDDQAAAGVAGAGSGWSR